MTEPRIAFRTFGCKLNFSETSTISRIFREKGYHTVEHDDVADVYVIHSCSVTGNAEKKCRAAIRQAKKRNPSATVAVIGCFAQLKPEELGLLNEVDLILGNNEKFQLYDHLENLIKSPSLPKPKRIASGILKEKKFFPAYSSGDRTRSFLKVQDGCDYFCSYCTIPMARGPSRSNTIEQTMALARTLAGSEVKEVILTGVNIGDFGKHHSETLAELMASLDRLNGIDRIRLSSIEPDLLTDEIIDIICRSDKFMPHFHIPLQSGSDKILRSMNRKYDKGLFDQLIHKIRSRIPDACIAADVIVGFPGETSDDFKATVSYVEEAPLSYVHVFTYSPRPDTSAYKMGDQVPGAEKMERSRILHDVSARKKLKFYQNNIGRNDSVLFESTDHGGMMEGWTRNYIRAKAEYSKNCVNNIFEVRLDELDSDHRISCSIIKEQ